MLTQSQFQKYHHENPSVYAMFEMFTLQAIRSGRKYLGAKMIAERCRWESMIKGNDKFKINNNYTSFYARMFEAKHPFHTGFFRKRRAVADQIVFI